MVGGLVGDTEAEEDAVRSFESGKCEEVVLNVDLDLNPALEPDPDPPAA